MDRLPWKWICLAAFIAFPFIPGIGAVKGIQLGPQLVSIFIFGILALGLNVVVGQAGLLQLGIAAFFAIGAYITGILTVADFPFQVGFWWAVLASTAGAALAGVVLGAPTLRLRGDYLAIVTLGFAEVIKYTFINLEQITSGSRGLNPVPPPSGLDRVLFPVVAPLDFTSFRPTARLGLGWFPFAPDWTGDYRLFYFLCLGVLVLVVVLLKNLENSRLGRALTAIREDELAASCMGVNTVLVKLITFAIGAGLAGLAGSLYATRLQTTAQPTSYDFAVSIITLCFLIVGGLGNCYGVLLGVLIIRGIDVVLLPILDQIAQEKFKGTQNVFLQFTNWKWMIFGLALVLMMRFRPEGLLPAAGIKEEMHEGEEP